MSFVGFQDPIEYDKRASVLLLTSEYEGFPLGFAECMSLGVVPVVCGRYSAVYDIIESGKNGTIVEPKNGKFDSKTFAEVVLNITRDEDNLKGMEVEAIATGNRYYIEYIWPIKKHLIQY